MPAFQFLSRIVRSCGGECISIQDGHIRILEEACAACLHRAKLCPGDAVRVVNLPVNLETNVTHRFGPNSFKLHGLPTPRRGSVLGLLGGNGIGKSTALSILSGVLKPNLGRLDHPPAWAELASYFRGSELQRYFSSIAEGTLKVASKPQLEGSYAASLRGMTVEEVLHREDERGRWNELARRLDMLHLLDRECSSLSGGELQRLAICRTANRQADVYIFDEPSAFLDIKQRVAAVDVIGALVSDEDDGNIPERYVVVVEHDLAVLDSVADYVCCLYGNPGAYGVVTKIASASSAINSYLAGYFKAENMRFRSEPISFETIRDSHREVAAGSVHYPAREQVLVNEAGSRFSLHIESGAFRPAEVVGMLGENGCGKTTFIEYLAEILSGRTEMPGGALRSLQGTGVSYKRQHFAQRLRQFPGTVQELFERCIQSALADRLFRLLVLKPLDIEHMEQATVRSLSGGQLQRVAIALCLGKPATVYLLDEPSAGLDCEQRIAVAKVIRRWIVDQLNCTAFVIEHDFVMASALADRVIVYSGEPGIECTAHSPTSVNDGFNMFLQQLDVTIRRDPKNWRPRVNRRGCVRHREQVAAGKYFIFDDEDRQQLCEAHQVTGLASTGQETRPE